MERRFDMSDFEQSLKDHADQFRLIPSRRVWNGIYNNLHPGSKWPSITVAIAFLISLVTIGNLNNSPKNSENKNIIADRANNSSLHVFQTNDLEKNNHQDKVSNKINSIKSDQKVIQLHSFEKKNIAVENLPNTKRQKIGIYKKSSPALVISLKEGTSGDIKEKKIENVLLKNPESFFSTDNDQSFRLTEIGNTKENEIAIAEDLNLFRGDLIIPVSLKINAFASPNIVPFDLDGFENIQLTNNNSKPTSSSEKTAIKKPVRKKNKNIEWTFYVTPLISSVSFEKRRPQPQNPSSLMVLPNQTTVQLIRNPKLGLETGAEMAYRISAKLKFITGFNLNYSSYNNVSNLIHPTFGNLILKEESGSYTKSYLTHYGNGQSPSTVSLINYNLEFSVPVGLQFNIWQNRKMQIDFASSLAPSYVFKSNAFLSSSDQRYYVNDPTLIRKLNMAASFSTFLTFKVNKIKWHIGPDFRYQVLSTYKNIYPNKEHFLDYGIRIGISK